MYPCLVADIGGTNARFCLVTGCEAGRYQMLHQKDLRSGDYSSFEACLQAYLDSVGIACPEFACVALAGPVVGDVIHMTNVQWTFSQTRVKDQFGFQVFQALNDFTALAYSVTHLQEGDLETVLPGQPESDAPSAKAIIGPGTGLGVSALIPHGSHWLAIPSEGGHVAYAAQTDREMALARLWQQRGYVSSETLLSGRGLVNVFNGLAELDGNSRRVEEASEIAQMAFEQQEPLALEAMNIFCEGLGTAASDVVVMFNAKGGVYLGGGILPRMVDFFRDSGFEQRFKHKGVQSGFLASVPVHLILHKHPALIGAAAWLDDHLNP